MRRAAVLAGLVSLLSGWGELDDDPDRPGAGDEVVTDWDRSVDFTALMSFGFVAADEAAAPDSVGLTVTRVGNAVRREYEALGIQGVEDPDVEVAILTYTEDASSLELDCVPSGFWYGTTGGYNSCAFLELERNDVTIGTLLIGIGDAARQEIVFNAAMKGVANGKDIKPRINRGVGDVFRDYPADQTGA